MSVPRKRPARSAPVVELSYRFGFDAAHHFRNQPKNHLYRGVHGHSFQAEIALLGIPRAPHGFAADFAKVERACLALRRKLDHRILNDIPDLLHPSLEHLAIWIWNALERKLPGLCRVTVRRESLGQACSYFGNLTDTQEHTQ